MPKRISALAAFAATQPDEPAGLAYDEAEALLAELRTRLQANFTRYAEGARDASAFDLYCRGMAKAVDQVPNTDALGGRRQRLIGSYFEAALDLRRAPGRPTGNLAPLFLWLWERVDRDHGKPRQRAPAQAIAALCAREGRGSFTPDQIRKTLARARGAGTGNG